MESQNTFQSIPPLSTLKRSFKKIVAINSLASKDNPIRKAQRSKNEVIKTGSYDNSHSPSCCQIMSGMKTIEPL